MAKLLADNVLPENRDYLYHHYNDNCVTRLRDMIDTALGGSSSEADECPRADDAARAHAPLHRRRARP